MSPPYSLMGIVNVTPDSFSDGGLFLDASSAVTRAFELVDEGADILDVGGESTRPGAQPVSAGEELRRVLPVVQGICASAIAGGDAAVRISIDTSKAAVAEAAIAAGTSIVNDVTALRGDPEMVGVVAASGVECCLMHMRGQPRSMQTDPRYGDVVDDVRAFLEERMAYAVREGVREERILLDPGIGFGKTLAHNLTLLRRLDELVALGRPVLIGTSRKGFLGRLIADAYVNTNTEANADASADADGNEPAPVPVAERLPGTIATNVLAFARGARVFRVHDVAPIRAALAVAAATLR